MKFRYYIYKVPVSNNYRWWFDPIDQDGASESAWLSANAEKMFAPMKFIRYVLERE